MKFLSLLLVLFIQTSRAEVSDPYAISSKVQSDLDNSLSRLIPPEQFLVQVNADISTRTERRIVEGDTLISPSEPRRKPVDPMPGFIPETFDKPEAPVLPSRQTFRLVEVPEVRAVRVSVNFDTAVDRPTLTQAQFLVRSYLQANYRGLAALTFSSIPMLKAEKEPVRDIAAEKEKWELERAEKDRAEREKAEREKAEREKNEKPPLSESDIIWSYARWAICGVLALLLLLAVRQKGEPSYSGAPAQRSRPRGNSPSKSELAALLGDQGQNSRLQRRPAPEQDEDANVEKLRRKLIERFITRAQAFRQYFETLSKEAGSELYSCVSGPAMDRLLSGLGMPRPSDDGQPSNADEILERHIRVFEEYIQAKDWQDRQFFGFLQNMSDEQLATIVASQKPLAACVVVRMLQPKQSAAVLDLLSSSKRHEILSQVASISEVPFSEVVAIEKEVRSASQIVPDRFLGSQKVDADFWGSVVSESSDQDPIFEELERTRPEIAPQLKKFKFRLEEAASLPDSLLEKVLGGVDNEELCLALSTCAADVREVIFDALSASRRNLLKNLFPTYRGAPRDRALPARAKLTRKIREALV